VQNVTLATAVFLNTGCLVAARGCTSVPVDRCTVSTRCSEQGLTCGDDARCVPPRVVISPDPHVARPDAAQPSNACTAAMACGECTAQSACGWCIRTGVCMLGNNAGSLDRACVDADWDWAGLSCDSTEPPACASDVPRTCGLTVAGPVRRCTPGSTVTVGCNQGCSTPLGSCSGDPVMQICPGSATTPCADALGSNDDGLASPACTTASDAGGPSGAGGLCPVVTFACPPDGRYTVWVGEFDGTIEPSATVCTPAVR
jgi:hypothetical protein